MTMHPRFRPFNFAQWIADNQASLKPPVGNKLLHDDSGMIVMVVGGPNTRVDFHDDPVEEWFYQLKGDMMLKIAEGGKIYDLPIRQGEVFMMAPHIGVCAGGQTGPCKRPAAWYRQPSCFGRSRTL